MKNWTDKVVVRQGVPLRQAWSFLTGKRARSGKVTSSAATEEENTLQTIPGSQIKSFSDVQDRRLCSSRKPRNRQIHGHRTADVQGVKKDYLKVKYAGEDSLYIPVDQLGMLQKYVGGDGVTPRLNKLSGGEWKRPRRGHGLQLMIWHEELIRVSAARMHEKGYAFSEDTVWQGEFEAASRIRKQRINCDASRKSKMTWNKSSPMDRLLCGDVGFGKTEVAARALFKCVADGKQAAVFVPTTLLANQHYYNMKERFEKFPFKVEMLSRVQDTAQQKTHPGRRGKRQRRHVIGTHRLLSYDVKFKDLGLLVIDEEQRFGVKHKERSSS